ncbi:unnamed protein product [Mytilus edulis]|uniref:Reverse transcriptase domain-containing protein n=1 Tax=Mytilus edulis TaxID=6550 RepID=A0A8S3SY38_MYTED|nr:unnamed protein product [Mytilus edulis]
MRRQSSDVFACSPVFVDGRRSKYCKTNNEEKDIRSDELSNKILEECTICSDLISDTHWLPIQDKFISDHEIIFSSNMYNYEGVRIPLDTHLNIDFFKFMLSDYHDRDICALLEFGFPVGYDYKKHIHGASCTVQNHKGAIQFSNDIDKYLRKEIEKKALLGPFHSNPFSHEIIISPLNSVPKKDTVERRVILDLSTHGGGGVNGGINKDLYLGEEVHLKYPNVDALVEIIKSKGPGCLCFKRDLSRAYRQINIDPHDVHLVGYHWRDHLYFDRVLSMGLCSAAQICQRFTNAVAYIYRLTGFDIINYLDDFAGAETSENAFKAFKELEALFLSCGIEESTHKAFSPSHRMEFLGIICDTVKLTLEIPDDKLKDIRSILGSWEGRQSAKLRDIQFLIGKLNFLATCVRPGRVFMSRLLNWLREVYNRKGYISIPSNINKDIVWWQKFVPLYNGISMMSLEEWSKPDEIFSSDSCITGCGGWFSGRFFHRTFPKFILEYNLHINCLELLAIVICLKLWGQFFKGRKIRILCDNQVSVTVINTGRSRNEYLQMCLREICYLCALSEFEVRACHVPGSDNRISDYLSRWHLSDLHRTQFFNSVSSNLEEFEVEDSLFSFSHNVQFKQLEKDVKKSTKSAFAVGTKKNLVSQWRAFLLFCFYFDVAPIPVTFKTINCYAQFLSRSFKSTDSIRNYINGVKIMHFYLDLPFPPLDNFEFKLLMAGISRVKQHCPRQARPITPDLLKEMLKFLDLDNCTDIVYWCLFLFAFFLMSRKSNLVPDSVDSFDCKRQLTRGKVFMHERVAIVVFEWTKTIQCGERILKIPLVKIDDSILCPVTAYNRMCRMIPAPEESPAFVIKRNASLKTVTYKQFQSKLKRIISLTGRDPRLYSTHSFRRGGASFAFQARVPSELIQLHGDWASDAYKLYLNFTMQEKISVAESMAKLL